MQVFQKVSFLLNTANNIQKQFIPSICQRKLKNKFLQQFIRKTFRKHTCPEEICPVVNNYNIIRKTQISSYKK